MQLHAAMHYHTHSSKETRSLGKIFAQRIVAKGLSARRAVVVGLIGDLGAGKTTFMQGFLYGCGVRRYGQSPTFIFVRKYLLRKKKFRALFHVDAYRIRNPKEIKGIGLHEMCVSPEHIIVIEWADKIKKTLPRHMRVIRFSYGAHPKERVIKLSSI